MLRKFVRLNKNDDFVQKVQLLDASPLYASIRYGREGNISISDLSPCPRESIRSEVDSQNFSVADEELSMRLSLDDTCHEQIFSSIRETKSLRPVSQEFALIRDIRKFVEIAPPNGNINNTEDDDRAQQRSSRLIKGAHPVCYGYVFSHKGGKIVV